MVESRAFAFAFLSTPDRRLLLAMAVSVILHAAMFLEMWHAVGGGHFSGERRSVRLEARLRAPALATQPPPPAGDDAPEVKPEAIPLKARPVEEKTVVVPQEVARAVRKAADEASVPSARQTPAEQHQSSDAGAASDALASFEEGPPSVVDIELDIFTGSETNPLGRARAIYTGSAGNYSVDVEGDATQDNVATGGQKWRLQVLGRIRHAGLSPGGYSGEGEVARQLVGEGKGPETSSFARRMQDGLLDGQSLFFQFMHLPIERMKVIPVASADGRFHIFEASRQDDEVIEVESLGAVKTSKYLYRTQGSTETYEVWLLVQSRAVPMRIRHTSADGTILDQRVRTLRATR